MDNYIDFIERGKEYGFGLRRQLCKPNPTALEVVQQYEYAKTKGFLSKNDKANYNNRWLQFKGDFIGQFKKTYEFMKREYGIKDGHIYANWVMDGHHYGRHDDVMDVIIVQMWNRVAYTVESEMQHSSFTLSPGDALYIRAGVFHTPVVLEERATMSFSW